MKQKQSRPWQTALQKKTIDNINNAETVQAAADALQAGKDKISAIGGQEESIDKLKESAKEEVEELKSTVDDPTTMTWKYLQLDYNKD